MAHIETTGFSDLLKDLEALGEDVNEMSDDMLAAGSTVAVDAWKKGIENVEHKIVSPDGKGYQAKRGDGDTGDMRDSVARAEKSRKNTAEIYPQGKDRKGVRNAEKAFVLHYGTSSYQGSRFVDGIEEKAAPEVYVAMGDVMDEYLKKHNL